VNCYTSIPKTLGLLLLGFAMCGVCYFVAVTAAGFTSYIGWCALAFFGACILAIAFQLWRRKPIVAIDAEGIRVARGGHKPVAWSQVESVAIGATSGQRFLCIELCDEAAYVAQLPRLRQMFVKANRSLGFPALSISFNGLTPGLDEACAYIEALLRARWCASGARCVLICSTGLIGPGAPEQRCERSVHDGRDEQAHKRRR
jgi:hypothetical protein